MSAKSLFIHPTAIISAEAELEPEVRIGPYTIIEGPVHLGRGTVGWSPTATLSARAPSAKTT
jgi:acyl-[acyl carrier protein]--UDP-N-acetylglucosamine O-acyltransferase